MKTKQFASLFGVLVALSSLFNSSVEAGRNSDFPMAAGSTFRFLVDGKCQSSPRGERNKKILKNIVKQKSKTLSILKCQTMKSSCVITVVVVKSM